MSDERWQRVKGLFQAAMEQPAEKRDGFLTAATGDDDELRREVESLLIADAAGTGFLDRLPVASDALLADPLNRRAAWCRRHGGSVQGARDAAEPHRRDQGPEHAHASWTVATPGRIRPSSVLRLVIEGKRPSPSGSSTRTDREGSENNRRKQSNQRSCDVSQPDVSPWREQPKAPDWCLRPSGNDRIG